MLTLQQLPNRVRVETDTEFGAHNRFVQASMSPNGDYLAFTTSGTAHSAAWIYRLDGSEPEPAAFQYGGNLRLSLWHPDSEYLVVMHSGPGGGATLSVTDIARLGATVAEANTPVRTPFHEEIPPEQQNYDAIAWEDGKLRFNMSGAYWLYHPDEGVSEY
ncbi:hypothetical protein CWE09_07380 [Aliidiomarina minuta]|uniref:S9 family peptidase n=1 Tax=Aliidiomarina minuta TaxID=880057 RepID=A0A432W8Q7_9GAMM|nr:hypothetical protein [Aliidiomarina minuta]RUO26520.1 hypothetical protein CWE09_07380 [Aliidiomarina minuta]